MTEAQRHMRRSSHDLFNQFLFLFDFFTTSALPRWRQGRKSCDDLMPPATDMTLKWGIKFSFSPDPAISIASSISFCRGRDWHQKALEQKESCGKFWWLGYVLALSLLNPTPFASPSVGGTDERSLTRRSGLFPFLVPLAAEGLPFYRYSPGLR